MAYVAGEGGYRYPVRSLAVATFLGIVSLANADWLIDIPTGRKIIYQGYHLEWRSESLQGGFSESRFGYGIGKSFDLTVRTQALGSPSATVGAVDFSFAALPAVPGISPGVTVGVLDCGDRTADGRRGFASLTFREDFESIDGTLLADVTIGAFFGTKSAGFVGFAVPLTRNFRFVGEHNGIRISGGVEYNFAPHVAFRLLERDRSLLMGVSLASRF